MLSDSLAFGIWELQLRLPHLPFCHASRERIRQFFFLACIPHGWDVLPCGIRTCTAKHHHRQRDCQAPISSSRSYTDGRGSTWTITRWPFTQWSWIWHTKKRLICPSAAVGRIGPQPSTMSSRLATPYGSATESG